MTANDFERALHEAIRRAEHVEPVPTDPPATTPVLDEAPVEEPDLDALLAAALADVVVPPVRHHSTAAERDLAVRAWRRLTADGLLRVPAASRLADATGRTYQSILSWADAAPAPVPPTTETPVRPAPPRRPFSQTDLARESFHSHFQTDY